MFLRDEGIIKGKGFSSKGKGKGHPRGRRKREGERKSGESGWRQPRKKTGYIRWIYRRVSEATIFGGRLTRQNPLGIQITESKRAKELTAPL